MTLFVFGLLLSLVSITVIVRVHRGKSPLEYVPVLVESTLPFVLLVLAALPRALPSLFQRLLGHSIDADYTVVRGSGGMKITETWFLGRWLEPLHSLAIAVIAVGIALAGWNLFKRSSRTSNIVALCLGIVWIVVGLMRHLLLAPFD
jgi:hypothetical protein